MKFAIICPKKNDSRSNLAKMNLFSISAKRKSIIVFPRGQIAKIQQNFDIFLTQLPPPLKKINYSIFTGLLAR